MSNSEKKTKWRSAEAAAESTDISGVAAVVPPAAESFVNLDFVTPPAPPTYENYKNIALPEILTPVSGGAAAAPPPPSESGTIIEGFDGNDAKEGAKKAIEYLFYPVKLAISFNPNYIADNHYVNQTILFLAGPPILESWAKSNSEYLHSYDISNIDFSGNTDFSGNKYLTTKHFDSSANWFSTGIPYLSADERSQKYMMEQAKAACDNGDPNADQYAAMFSAILHDSLILKEYIFKTVMLLFAFLMTYNWAYLFFRVNSKKDKCKQVRELVGLEANASAAVDPNSVFLGAFGIKIREYIEKVYVFLGEPFYYAMRMMDIANWALFERLANYEMVNFLDKKIWYMIIFFFVYQANKLFFHNYTNYMKDVKNMSQNTVTSIFIIIMVFMYLTQRMPLMRIIKLILSPLPTIITIMFVNIYLWICLYFNPYVALFLFILFYIIFSVFSRIIYPTLSLGEILYGTRSKEMLDDIKVDAYTKYENTPEDSYLEIIWKYIKYFLHKFYDNFTFLVLFFWLRHLILVFDEKLQDENIKLNVFTVLMVFMLILFIWRVIFNFTSVFEFIVKMSSSIFSFFGIKTEKEPPAAAATDAAAPPDYSIKKPSLTNKMSKDLQSMSQKVKNARERLRNANFTEMTKNAAKDAATGFSNTVKGVFYRSAVN